jgi:hypothetical protein
MSEVTTLDQVRAVLLASPFVDPEDVLAPAPRPLLPGELRRLVRALEGPGG